MNRHFSRLSACLLCMALAIPEAVLAQTPASDRGLGLDGLYFPSVRYTFTEFERATTYLDVAGLPRTVNALIRVPTGAPRPLPVVIWSHGGARGKENPRKSLAEWSIVTAEAGFLTVSIAHTPREAPPAGDSRRRLCQALVPPLDDAACKVFKHLSWDRPHDIRAVVDALERMNAQGELRGQIDVLRIAVGGHSAGSGGALMVAGALRKFGGAPVDLSDPRPVAFLAFSPQQPGSDGFFDTGFKNAEHSWKYITRPVLVATGDGDSTCKPGVEPGSCIGETPFGRRIAFARMPSGSKYHLYVHDESAFHTLFALGTSKCALPRIDVDQRKCDEIARWLESAALAFLDGHVRGDALALEWLRSDNTVAASRSVVEWLTK